jgi:hypothetical protein
MAWTPWNEHLSVSMETWLVVPMIETRTACSEVGIWNALLAMIVDI